VAGFSGNFILFRLGFNSVGVRVYILRELLHQVVYAETSLMRVFSGTSGHGCAGAGAIMKMDFQTPRAIPLHVGQIENILSGVLARTITALAFLYYCHNNENKSLLTGKSSLYNTATYIPRSPDPQTPSTHRSYRRIIQNDPTSNEPISLVSSRLTHSSVARRKARGWLGTLTRCSLSVLAKFSEEIYKLSRWEYRHVRWGWTCLRRRSRWR
jgi:hypothetical protein